MDPRAGLPQSKETQDEEDDDDSADKVDDTAHKHILCKFPVRCNATRKIHDPRLRAERLCSCAPKDLFFPSVARSISTLD